MDSGNKIFQPNEQQNWPSINLQLLNQQKIAIINKHHPCNISFKFGFNTFAIVISEKGILESVKLKKVNDEDGSKVMIISKFLFRILYINIFQWK